MTGCMRGRIRMAAAVALVCAGWACAEPPPPLRSAFVATLGPNDTVAVERYTRTGDTLKGTSVAAYPRVSVRSYTVVFGPDGKVAHVHIRSGRPMAETVTNSDWTYTGDSVHVEMHRDTTTQRYSVGTGADRPLPFFEDLFAFWDVSLQGAMATGADSTSFESLAGRQAVSFVFRRLSTTDADFSWPEWGTVHAFMGQDGRLDGLDMTATTSKYTVTRVPAVDLEGTSAAWSARPDPGALSPRDTASATVGRAHVVVDYGRPSVRGRTVYGGELIPFNQVWRTGANAATQLITDRPLVLGGTTFPAGTYSVWSEATDSTTWALIINKQHGQWGTQHDASQDLASIPLKVSRLASPVERFTITVAPTSGSAGSITLAWGNVQGTVGFRVR